MNYLNTYTPEHKKCLEYSLFFLVGMGNYPVLGLNDLEHEAKTFLGNCGICFLVNMTSHRRRIESSWMSLSELCNCNCIACLFF
jgi:hypothetical protein